MTPIFDKFIYYILEGVGPDMGTLTRQDLYNFYYLITLHSMGQITDDYGKFIINEQFKRLKIKYVELFSHLLYEQIKKYIKRGRVDLEVSIENLEKNKNNPPKLYDLMSKTYRSDMKRRNDVWNFVAEYVMKLASSNNIKDIGFFIDRINNCIHNTQELLFSKFPNAQSLMQAFDQIHKAPSLNAYKSFVSKDIRDINT